MRPPDPNQTLQSQADSCMPGTARLDLEDRIMAKDICIQDCAPAECSGSANGGKQGSSEWQGARAADDACDSEAGATGLMLSTNQTYESKHSNSTMHSPDENSSRRLEGGAGGSGHRSHDPDSAKVPSAAVQTAVLSKCTTERADVGGLRVRAAMRRVASERASWGEQPPPMVEMMPTWASFRRLGSARSRRMSWHDQMEAADVTQRDTSWCRYIVPLYNPHARTTDSYWDLVILMALVYVAICTPFEISFLTESSSEVLWGFNRILDLVFIFDMILSFNTAFMDENKMVICDRWQIALQYFKGYFIIDFVSLIPVVGVLMNIFKANVETKMLQILRIVRLLRLTKLVQLLRKSKTFEYIESRRAINYSLVQLYVFLFGLFYLTHFLACGWYLVILLEDNRECIIHVTYVESQACCYNWWSCFGPHNVFSTVMDPQSPARKYFIALEWALGEMLTVGSPVEPTTDAERTYLLFVHVIAGLVYAYLIGTVVAIFDSMTRAHKDFFGKMDHLNLALQVHNVDRDNPELCARLRTFYRHRNTHFVMDSCLQEVFSNVTDHLRALLTQQVYAKQIMRLELFSRCEVSEEMVADISVHLRASPFGPNERLLQLDHMADHFFLLQMGIVLSQARVIVEGSVLGVDAIYAPRSAVQRGYDAITITHGIVNRMDVVTLLNIVHSPRYSVLDVTARVSRRITVGRILWVLREFTRCFQNAVKMGSFADGITECTRALDDIWETCENYQGKPFFKTVDHLFFSFWIKHHPKDGKMLTALRSKIKVKSAVQNFLNQRILVRKERELMTVMRQYGLPLALCEKILMVERLDLNELYTLSALELHAVGFPMGIAKQFVRDQNEPSSLHSYPLNNSGQMLTTAGCVQKMVEL